MKRLQIKNIIYLVPIIFITIAVIRSIIIYFEIESQESKFVQHQAELLNDFMLVHRHYYQNLYLTGKIPLNEMTLEGLPAFSSSLISHAFSEKNSFDITVKTVSNRARNERNSADTDELEAIAYFNKHKDKQQFFDAKNSYYQFARVLKIEKKCLQCHGQKEDAPRFIREKYDMAYGYELDDVRGIISIKIPKKVVHGYFFNQFIVSIFYDFMLLALLFLFLNYLLRRFKIINDELEEIVEEKTRKLSTQKAVLESYIKALDQTSIISKSDLNGVITYVNDAFVHHSGYTREELLGKPHSIVRHPETPDKLIAELWRTIKSKNIFSGTLNWLTKDGEKLTLKVFIVPVIGEDDTITEYIAARTDISELILSKEELSHTLLTDPLTGTANRLQLLKTIEIDKDHGALALLNIDNFKEINDFYGHKVGDSLLTAVVSMLKQFCKEEYEALSFLYSLSIT